MKKLGKTLLGGLLIFAAVFGWIFLGFLITP